MKQIHRRLQRAKYALEACEQMTYPGLVLVLKPGDDEAARLAEARAYVGPEGLVVLLPDNGRRDYEPSGDLSNYTQD